MAVAPSELHTKPRILFLCTGNSCRSQMAEGFGRARLGRRFAFCSAGTSPGAINRLAVAVMREIGIDIARQQPKHVDALASTPVDLVIAVCSAAAEACPTFSGAAQVVHHPFNDPPVLAASATSDAEALPHYRLVRDEIAAFIDRLPSLYDQLTNAPVR